MTKVKYTDKYVQDGEYFLPEYKTKMVEDLFVQEYTGTLAKLFTLSSRATRLLFYLKNIMDPNNIVRTDKYVRDKFNKILQEAGLPTYSDSNIVKALTELKNKKFLFQEQRGIYIVNPEYYGIGKKDKRIDKIQILLEFQAGVRPSLSIENKYKPMIAKKQNNENQRRNIMEQIN